MPPPLPPPGSPQDIAQRTARLAEAAQKAAAQQVALNIALQSPAYASAVRQTQSLAAENKSLVKTEKQLQDLAIRRANVASGAYGRELNVRREIARETAKIVDLERRAGFTARYRTVGGSLAYATHLIASSSLTRAGLGVAGAAGAGITGLALNGYRGTVEWNRLQLELHSVSRELAGAFLPAIRISTKGLGVFRKWLEGLGGGAQSALMLGALGLGAVGAGRFAMGGLGMAIGATGAGLVSGAARRAAIPIAVKEILGLSTGEASGAAVGYAALRGARAARLAGGGLRAAGKFLWPIGAALTGYDAFTGGYYSTARNRGSSRAVSGLTAGGLAALNFVTFGYGADLFGYSQKDMAKTAAEARARPKTPPKDHRNVLLAQSGFESPNSAYDRLSAAAALAYAGPNTTGPLTVESLLQDIRALVKEALDFFTSTDVEAPN